jgi:DNA-binding LacI/PurR family transcriptional regulator
MWFLVTLKELAAYTGLSVSTVSLVLRGEAKQRGISQGTQDKIWRAVKKYNYHPNISARRLRSQAGGGLIVGIFWTMDFRTPLMVRFLRGIQEAALACGRNLEIIIHPYKGNELHRERSLIDMNMFNAAIIANMSPADMEFLETTALRMPIVLHNRVSGRFCTVYVDEYRQGCIAAEVFASQACRRAAVISAKTPFRRWDERTRGFADTCGRLGIDVARTFMVDYTMAGGYGGGLMLGEMPVLPQCLFCPSDTLALGALRAFYRKGVRVPEDLKIITIGNGDPEVEEFAYTSLSAVSFPIEEMARECLHLLLDVVAGKASPPHSIELATEYIPRESCGGVGPAIKTVHQNLLQGAHT